MPKKTDPPESQEAQSQRFLETARAIEADGGLSPTEVSDAMDKVLSRLSSPNREDVSADVNFSTKPTADI